MDNKIIDINEVVLRDYVESLRPEDPLVRAQVDIGYSYDGKVAYLFEIRPIWKGEGKIGEFPYAKIRFIKSSQEWKLYWLRASGKWELYEKPFKSSHIGEALDIINQDKHGCFYG